MWEEEKKKKGKTESLFSNGVVILVFLILAAQSVFFARHLILERGAGKTAADSTAVMPTDAPERDSIRLTPVPKPTESRQNSGRRQSIPVAAERHEAAYGTALQTDTDTDGRRESQQREYGYDGWKWDMVELNSADSTALDGLPGIGPYYAKQILRYRERIGCYADISQLLDIRGIDTALLRRLDDRLYIEPSSIRRIDLRTMSVDSMSAHPYIGPYAAKGIDRLRRIIPDSLFCVQAVLDNGIITPAQARRLTLYCD